MKLAGVLESALRESLGGVRRVVSFYVSLLLKLASLPLGLSMPVIK